MTLSERLIHYFLPKHLRNHPLHPEYEEAYSVIRMQVIACLVMFVVTGLLYVIQSFLAPYFLVNTVLVMACLPSVRMGLFQEANLTKTILLYIIYFPAFLNSGGIYSVFLSGLYVMLIANMHSHKKRGVYFIIPALATVWLLYVLTPDSAPAQTLWGSRLYVALYHSLAVVFLVLIITGINKKRSHLIGENKALQNNTINTLNEEVNRRTKELNNMRKTLAVEFHDETGNMLSAITRQAALLKQKLAANPDVMNIVDHIISNSNQLYASSRHFIWNLNNDSDDPQILFNYLTSFGQVFYNQFDISFSAENEVPGSSSTRLESFAAINLIFIFKEAMNNVVKHAEAKEAVLKMTQKGGQLYFSLTDDGSWKQIESDGGHHGLNNMEKRCRQNSFGFGINHIDGIGTRVEIAVPAVYKQRVESILA